MDMVNIFFGLVILVIFFEIMAKIGKFLWKNRTLVVIVALLMLLAGWQNPGMFTEDNNTAINNTAAMVENQEGLRSDLMNIINMKTAANCYAALHAYENFDGYHVLCANNNEVAFGEVEATAGNTTAYLVTIADVNGKVGVKDLKVLGSAEKDALFILWGDYLDTVSK